MEADKLAQAYEETRRAKAALEAAEDAEISSKERMESIHKQILEIERTENRRNADPDLVKKVEAWGARIDEVMGGVRQPIRQVSKERYISQQKCMEEFVKFMQENGIKLRFVDDNFGYDCDSPEIRTVDVEPRIVHSCPGVVFIAVPPCFDSGQESDFDIAIPYSDYRWVCDIRKPGLSKMIVFPAAK